MVASLSVWKGTDLDEPINYHVLGARIAQMIEREMDVSPKVGVFIRIFPGNMIDVRVEREEIPVELDYQKS